MKTRHYRDRYLRSVTIHQHITVTVMQWERDRGIQSHVSTFFNWYNTFVYIVNRIRISQLFDILYRAYNINPDFRYFIQRLFFKPKLPRGDVCIKREYINHMCIIINTECQIRDFGYSIRDIRYQRRGQFITTNRATIRI